MTPDDSQNRSCWGSKLGFILAAAGSAIGLGSIWRFPGQVTDDGGASYLLIYFIATFLVGYPILLAELTLGRDTGKNPVGAFRALSSSRIFPFIGLWAIICAFMILTYYTVVAGWTIGFVFEELFNFIGLAAPCAILSDLANGPKNALFSLIFMLLTIFIVKSGVNSGIEKASKVMMPALIIILFGLIGYVFTQDGSMEGLVYYLTPDFHKIDSKLIFDALGQAFFALSLGSGAMITYGSYMSRKNNLAESAMFVTIADLGISFIAGLLIIPAMFVAQHNGIAIFAKGTLMSGEDLAFEVLPSLFHSMSPITGVVLGISFFILLAITAVTSTISMLEVPVAYLIDEKGWGRGKAAWTLGILALAISLVISFNISLIGYVDLIFGTIGLSISSLCLCIFLGYVWKTDSAISEISFGFGSSFFHTFSRAWAVLIKYIDPLIIGVVLLTIL